MAGTFHFELVSPERVLLSQEVEQVVVPGADGEFTVLVGHAPLISTLRPGVLDITTTGANHRRVFVKSGFVEVDPTRLTVLAERAVEVDRIDGAALASELQAAEADLANATDDLSRMRADSAVTALRAITPT